MTAFISRHRFKWGIASAMTLSMVFVIVLLMGLVTFIDIRRERSIARDGLERYGVLMANSLDEVLANDLYFFQIDALEDIAEVLVSQPQIAQVKIFRPDGRLLVEEPRGERGSDYVTGHLSNPAAVEAVRNGREWRQFGGTTLELAIPVSAGGDLLGGVQFSFTAEALNEEIRSIILAHLWQGLALIALGTGLAYLIARYTSRSIGDLAAVAGEIGRGNLDVPAPSRGTKETVELGQALERMRVQLQELYPNLEQRVQERTTELSRAAQMLQVEVSEREKAEQEQRRLTEESEMVAGIGRAIGSSLNVVEVYEGFADMVGRLVPWDWITINMLDLQRGTLTLAYTAGAEIAGRQSGTVVPLADTFTEAVAQSPQGLVLDVDNSEECARKYPGLVPYLDAGICSFLGVPLVSRGEVIATLNIVTSAPTAYTEHHLQLARNIGAQIAGAIANAETYSQREKAEQAARQIAAENYLLADVGRIITLSPNIEDVYHRFADRIREHMPFDYMSISLVGVETGVSTSAYVSGIDVPGRRAGDRIPLTGALTGVVISTRSAKLINTDNLEELARRYPALVPALDAGLRSFLSVPLIAGDEVIGVLNVRSTQQNAYSERELRLIEQVGRQIAPAIENGRLYDQLKSNAEELAVIDEVARIVTSTLEIEQVYEEFALEAKKLVDFDRMAVNLLEPESDGFVIKYHFGPYVPEYRVGTVALEGTQSQWVMANGRTLVREDLAVDPRFSTDQAYLSLGLRSSILLPLSSKGLMIGTLSMRSHQVGAFTSREQTILERLANQIAPAVENAQLYDQSKRAEDAERARNLELRALFSIASILAGPEGFEEKSKDVLRELSRISQADRVFLRIPDDKAHGLRLVAAAGQDIDEIPPRFLIPYGEGICGQAFQSGSAVVANDYPSHPRARPEIVNYGVKSEALLPIKGGGQTLAVVTFSSLDANHFTTERVSLLTAVADELGVLLENAKLSQDLSASKEEMAAIDEVARIITANLNIQQVYDQFASEVNKLVAFDRIYINLVDQDAGTSTAKYLSGVTEEGRVIDQAQPLAGTQSEVVVRTGESLIRRDIAENPRFTDDHTHLGLGLRASIALPLISKGEVIGSLGLRSGQVGAYGSREQAILERLASQIAPAVENAQLYDHLKSNAEEMAALDEIARIITSNLDIDQVYERFATEAKKHVSFDRIYVNRLDLESGTLELKYISGLPEEGLEPGRIGQIKGTQSEEILRTGESLVRDDIAQESRFNNDHTHLAVGFRSSIAIPLISKGEAIGILGLRSFGVGTYGLRERSILERLASQIAPALENAYLFEQLKGGQERLRNLSQRLVEVQEAERRHVARELHDEIGQVLTGLKLSLELIPRVPEDAVKANLEESKILVNELMGKVRELSLDLRPAMLDDLGLLPTLLWYFERFTARTQVDVGFEHTGLDRRFLPEVETTAYRIVQEALTNVARHAGANGVSVRFWSNGEVLGLSIEDHGAGFDAADESILNKSNGLAGMRERATLLGGRLTLESAPGLGTNLFAELPFSGRNGISVEGNAYDNHNLGG